MVKDDAAARERIDRPASDPHTFIDAEITVGFQVLCTNRLLFVQVHDGKVRVGSDLDGALAGIQTEHPCGRLAADLGNTLQWDAALMIAPVDRQWKQGANAIEARKIC